MRPLVADFVEEALARFDAVFVALEARLGIDANVAAAATDHFRLDRHTGPADEFAADQPGHFARQVVPVGTAAAGEEELHRWRFGREQARSDGRKGKNVV